MYLFGELPSDLRDQDTTLGPPPAWFQTTNSGTSSYPYWAFSHGFYGLGDREGEVEVDPVETLRELKFQQELSKKIPKIAYRYTDIDPLSPMYRDRKAKYGFGEGAKSGIPIWVWGLVAFAVIKFALKSR